jgi:hypothetical protein
MIGHKLPNKTKSVTVAEFKLFHQLNNPIIGENKKGNNKAQPRRSCGKSSRWQCTSRLGVSAAARLVLEALVNHGRKRGFLEASGDITRRQLRPPADYEPLPPAFLPPFIPAPDSSNNLRRPLAEKLLSATEPMHATAAGDKERLGPGIASRLMATRHANIFHLLQFGGQQ